MVSESFLWANPEVNTIRTVCNLCLNRCGLIASKEKNEITLRGDEEHPLSHGFLCVKGKASLDIAASSNRIKYPMRRVGDRGSQKWERISWDTALNEIAAKMKNIMANYGTESIAVQCLKGRDHLAWLAFARAVGSPTIFRHDVHVCYTPQEMADITTFGKVVTYPNLTSDEAAKTKTFVMWGVNMPETNPAKSFVLNRARKHGMKVIVIDPRPIKSAQAADLWLRIRPGTDLALALGMLNIIIKEHLYNAGFVDSWTYGFEKLAAHVEQYTPDKVSEITWVDKESIVEAARLIATNKPTFIGTFIGLTMSGHVINAIRSLGLLIAITGNIDNAGGNFIKISPQIGTIPFPQEILERQISADKFPLLSGPAGIPKRPNPSHVIDAILTGRPYPIKALLTHSNPLTSLEDSPRTLEALLTLELLVAIELFMTPTTEFADYVLPSTMFLESDFVPSIAAMNFIACGNRVLQPFGEAREETEILLDILKRAGLAEGLPFTNYQEYLDYKVRPLNMTFAEFSRTGYLINPNVERKYEKGLLRPDKRPGFNTPTGKIELYSTTMDKYGYDPLPVYREPNPSPYSTGELFKDYPFILITGTRSLPLYHGLGIAVSSLRKHHPYPIVEISPFAAKKLGVNDGDSVFIEVPEKTARVTRKVRIVNDLHDNVACAEGHWYLPEEQDQNKRLWEANINILTSLRDDFDPVVGGSGCRSLLCRITKAK
jgi:thiosulfate reductase/polysulfide reductase chain A